MIQSPELQTIIAQCTPRGSGAIALLRLSGPHALDIATRLSRLPNKKLINEVPTHTIHAGHVIDKNNNAVDYAMFLVMHGPRTFTGENVVEITTHNNQFIIQDIIEIAIKHGARLAHEGEFCKRAVMNDKIDLVQAEAINELIHANTQMALKQSLAQVEGSFSQWITQIEQDLLKALAFCQASFEFIDEEDMEFGDAIKDIITNKCKTIEQLKITFDQQQRIRQGIRIAIIGSVNAGKSSLFNALLQKDRAIVTHIAGTTRDVIEAGMYKQQNYWTLIDTAGLRNTDDIIEQKGIERSLKEAQLADIILLVVDSSRQMNTQEKQVYQEIAEQHPDKIITIFNKSDLPKKTDFQSDQAITITTQGAEKNINIVESAIEQKIELLLSAIESPFLLNKRQFNLLLALEQKLKNTLPLFGDNIAYELVSIHLQDAISDLSELTGKTISESAMDKVFREFCVGK
jgi:tRNA modification GTPase